eukprot:1196091-Prorocentrum_minimum.AAC.7
MASLLCIGGNSRGSNNASAPERDWCAASPSARAEPGAGGASGGGAVGHIEAHFGGQVLQGCGPRRRAADAAGGANAAGRHRPAKVRAKVRKNKICFTGVNLKIVHSVYLHAYEPKTVLTNSHENYPKTYT